MSRMICSLRLFFIACLILLQCLAPLIHAHAGKSVSSHGLHLPYLEHYSQPTPSSKALTHQMTAFSHAVDGQIVGVHTGFNRKLTLPLSRSFNVFLDDAPEYFLLLALIVIQSRNRKSSVVWFNQNNALRTLLPHSAHTPRAPPASLYF
jgi:hypothetical protein